MTEVCTLTSIKLNNSQPGSSGKSGSISDQVLQLQVAAAFLAIENSLAKMESEKNKELAEQTDRSIAQGQAAAVARDISSQSQGSTGPATSAIGVESASVGVAGGSLGV